LAWRKRRKTKMSGLFSKGKRGYHDQELEEVPGLPVGQSLQHNKSLPRGGRFQYWFAILSRGGLKKSIQNLPFPARGSHGTIRESSKASVRRAINWDKKSVLQFKGGNGLSPSGHWGGGMSSQSRKKGGRDANWRGSPSGIKRRGKLKHLGQKTGALSAGKLGPSQSPPSRPQKKGEKEFTFPSSKRGCKWSLLPGLNLTSTLLSEKPDYVKKEKEEG